VSGGLRRHHRRAADAAPRGGDRRRARGDAVPHTTAGVTINENADPSVRSRHADGARAARARDAPLHSRRGQLGRTREGEPDGQQCVRARRGRAPQARHLAGRLLLRVRRAQTATGRRRRRCRRPAPEARPAGGRTPGRRSPAEARRRDAASAAAQRPSARCTGGGSAPERPLHRRRLSGRAPARGDAAAGRSRAALRRS
jgi:hypothetical protein